MKRKTNKSVVLWCKYIFGSIVFGEITWQRDFIKDLRCITVSQCDSVNVTDNPNMYYDERKIRR